jgi:predicted nucleic acid-binding protein
VRRMSRTYSPMVVWWGTPVEAVSAFARLVREDVMRVTGMHQARTRLEALRRTWVEILPTESLRSVAETLPIRLSLRAGDVFQLAAALIWCREQPKGRPFISFDHRLTQAAIQAGFEVIAVPRAKS